MRNKCRRVAQPQFMDVIEYHLHFVPIELLSPPDLPRFAPCRVDMMH